MSVQVIRDDNGNSVLERYDYPNGVKQTLSGGAWTPAIPAGTEMAMITNMGTVTIYARGDGQAAVAAAATTIPIAGGSWRTVPCVGGLSIIGASGDVYVMPVSKA